MRCLGSTRGSILLLRCGVSGVSVSVALNRSMAFTSSIDAPLRYSSMALLDMIPMVESMTIVIGSCPVTVIVSRVCSNSSLLDMSTR